MITNSLYPCLHIGTVIDQKEIIQIRIIEKIILFLSLPSINMVKYTAEISKSNRSSCKKCKQKIEKEVIRIGTHTTNADDITMVAWNHLKCFAIPKKVDFRDFLEELEVDGLSADKCAEVRILVSKLLNLTYYNSICMI